MSLAIWIRKGEEKFGCLELMRFDNEEILYTKYVPLYNSIKHYYRCRISLEFEKSRWTFAVRCNPNNSFIQSMHPEYCKGDLQTVRGVFETSCKLYNEVMIHKLRNQQIAKILYENIIWNFFWNIFFQQMIWLLLQRDGTKYQFILIINVMKNRVINKP